MEISTGYIVWFLSVIPALWIDVAPLVEEASSSQIQCQHAKRRRRRHQGHHGRTQRGTRHTHTWWVLIGGKVPNEDVDVGAYGFRGGGPVVTGSWRSIGRGLEMGEDDGAHGGVCEGQVALERRRLRGRGHAREGVVIGAVSRMGWITRLVPPAGASLFDSRDRKG